MYKTEQIAHALVVVATCDAVYALMCDVSARHLLKNVTVSSIYTYSYRYLGEEYLCLHATEGGATLNGEGLSVPPPDTHKSCM